MFNGDQSFDFTDLFFYSEQSYTWICSVSEQIRLTEPAAVQAVGG